MPRSAHRRKVSATISPEAYEFLRRLVESGQAASLADAVDHIVNRARRTENRSRLEQATAAYFARLPRAIAQDEKKLGLTLGQSADEVGLDVCPKLGDVKPPLHQTDPVPKRGQSLQPRQARPCRP